MMKPINKAGFKRRVNQGTCSESLGLEEGEKLSNNKRIFYNFHSTYYEYCNTNYNFS